MTSRRCPRAARLLAAPLLALALLAGACGSGDVAGGGYGSAPEAASESQETSGERVEVGGEEALRWGDGPYGVVLAHGAAFDAASWEQQAVEIADEGATVLAVEDIAPESIASAVRALQADGLDDVALVGGSAGADAVLELVSEEPDLADQLVLFSPNRVVDGLGEQPLLVVASEDEAVADVATDLVEQTPGADHAVLLLPGDDHAQHLFDGPEGPAALGAMLDRLREFS